MRFLIDMLGFSVVLLSITLILFLVAAISFYVNLALGSFVAILIIIGASYATEGKK